ncbi:NAD(P)H-binding protein [Massilia rubra]|uniref:NAD(P)H-binding protein n=1 Tax=Massilia rubra TaxID=2607910 RepID=A0ABX0LH06_9BURK|nr:NAD(P)H-binding protein [Massilia rubra]NHZ33537.1 NAD(P)H-binding protein [Massilia rubra]
MQIGISGASGHLGQSTLKELAARGGGHELVGISRTPQAIAAPLQGRFGDYDEPSSLAAAYAGLDRLLLIPTIALAPGVRSRQNIAAIDAAVAAGVGHIVILSSCGARDIAEPDLYAPYFAAEQHLMRTAPRWSILRMNYFAEALAEEALGSLGHGLLACFTENRVAYVARDDVAASAAGLLTTDGHVGATYNLTGPAALTGEQRAAIIAKASGAGMGFLPMTEAAMRAALQVMGTPPDIARAVICLHHGMASGMFDIVTGDVQKLSGKAPRTLQQVLRKAFA